MESSVIYKTYLKTIRPIIWYGQAVHTHHSELKEIIRERLGENCAELLTDPVLPREALEGTQEALWLSGCLREAKPYSSLSEDEKCSLVGQLAKLLTSIEGLAEKLQGTDDTKQRQLGELLLKALLVPGLDCVYTDGEKISLVCWGFTSDDTEQTKFKLSQFIKSRALSGENTENADPASANGHSSAKIRIRVIDKNMRPAANIRVTASYKGASAEIDTDQEGRAGFPKVPVPSHVKISISLPDTESFEKDILCEKDGDEHLITLPLALGTNAAIRFEMTDALSRRLQNIPLRLEYKDIVLENTTDEDGKSEFADIPVGEKVTLHINLPKKKPFTKNFRCSQTEDIHKVVIEEISGKPRKNLLWILSGIFLLIGGSLLTGWLTTESPPVQPRISPPASSEAAGNPKSSVSAYPSGSAAPLKDCQCEAEIEALWKEIRQLKAEIRQNEKFKR